MEICVFFTLQLRYCDLKEIYIFGLCPQFGSRLTALKTLEFPEQSEQWEYLLSYLVSFSQIQKPLQSHKGEICVLLFITSPFSPQLSFY